MRYPVAGRAAAFKQNEVIIKDNNEAKLDEAWQFVDCCAVLYKIGK